MTSMKPSPLIATSMGLPVCCIAPWVKSGGEASELTPSIRAAAPPNAGESLAGPDGEAIRVVNLAWDRLNPGVFTLVMLLATTSRARCSASRPVAPM